MRKRDVAWGFFHQSPSNGLNYPFVARLRSAARYQRRCFVRCGINCGPIFRITAPPPKPTKKKEKRHVR